MMQCLESPTRGHIMSPERLQPLWNQNMRVKGKKKTEETKTRGEQDSTEL